MQQNKKTKGKPAEPRFYNNVLYLCTQVVETSAKIAAATTNCTYVERKDHPPIKYSLSCTQPSNCKQLEKENVKWTEIITCTCTTQRLFEIIKIGNTI